MYYSNFIVLELIHICNDISKFGPIYNYWMFGFERMNKSLKRMLHSQ